VRQSARAKAPKEEERELKSKLDSLRRRESIASSLGSAKNVEDVSRRAGGISRMEKSRSQGQGWRRVGRKDESSALFPLNWEKSSH